MAVVDLYQIGASGTRAYQAAMGAIGDNIANTNTAGYNRRTVEIRESAASASTAIWEKNGLPFAGVDIGQVFRANDPYLDLAARRTTNALGNVDQRARWMTDIQTGLNDGALGVGQRLSGMFSAIERLASNPTDTTLRTDVLFTFEQVNTAFKTTYDDLTTIRDGIGTTAQNEVEALNDAVKTLATANEGLRRVMEGSSGQAQLMDQRDQALSEIVKRINATVSIDSKGIATVDYNGASVVDNITPYAFSVSQNTDGTLAFKLDGQDVADPTTGALAGLVQSASITKERIDDLNAIAEQYVDDVNGWHTAGYTAAGDQGTEMLEYNGNAGSLKVLISDPTKIAGANAAGVMNGNLVNATSIRGENSVENKWTHMVSKQGNLASATLAEQTAASSRDQLAQQARGDVSGVNLDREAADLLRLQQAYQGCARVIQVARELVDTIFSIF